MKSFLTAQEKEFMTSEKVLKRSLDSFKNKNKSQRVTASLDTL